MKIKNQVLLVGAWFFFVSSGHFNTKWYDSPSRGSYGEEPIRESYCALKVF